MEKQSFVIMVTKPPYESRNAENALQFCKAALEMGHNIKQVFFYQSGVLSASYLQSPPSDELDIYTMWFDLHKQHSVALNVCIGASSRRGIVNAETTSNEQHFNVEPPFTILGMSEFFAKLTPRDKLIQL